MVRCDEQTGLPGQHLLQQRHAHGTKLLFVDDGDGDRYFARRLLVARSGNDHFPEVLPVAELSVWANKVPARKMQAHRSIYLYMLKRSLSLNLAANVGRGISRLLCNREILLRKREKNNPAG